MYGSLLVFKYTCILCRYFDVKILINHSSSESIITDCFLRTLLAVVSFQIEQLKWTILPRKNTTLCVSRDETAQWLPFAWRAVYLWHNVTYTPPRQHASSTPNLASSGWPPPLQLRFYLKKIRYSQRQYSHYILSHFDKIQLTGNSGSKERWNRRLPVVHALFLRQSYPNDIVNHWVSSLVLNELANPFTGHEECKNVRVAWVVQSFWF